MNNTIKNLRNKLSDVHIRNPFKTPRDPIEKTQLLPEMPADISTLVKVDEAAGKPRSKSFAGDGRDVRIQRTEPPASWKKQLNAVKTAELPSPRRVALLGALDRLGLPNDEATRFLEVNPGLEAPLRTMFCGDPPLVAVNTEDLADRFSGVDPQQLSTFATAAETLWGFISTKWSANNERDFLKTVWRSLGNMAQTQRMDQIAQQNPAQPVALSSAEIIGFYASSNDVADCVSGIEAQVALVGKEGAGRLLGELLATAAINALRADHPLWPALFSQTQAWCKTEEQRDKYLRALYAQGANTVDLRSVITAEMCYQGNKKDAMEACLKKLSVLETVPRSLGNMTPVQVPRQPADLGAAAIIELYASYKDVDDCARGIEAQIAHVGKDRAVRLLGELIAAAAKVPLQAKHPLWPALFSQVQASCKTEEQREKCMEVLYGRGLYAHSTRAVITAEMVYRSNNTDLMEAHLEMLSD